METIGYNYELRVEDGRGAVLKEKVLKFKNNNDPFLHTLCEEWTKKLNPNQTFFCIQKTDCGSNRVYKVLCTTKEK